MYEVHTIHYITAEDHQSLLNSIQPTFIRLEIGAIKQQCRSHSESAELVPAGRLQIHGTVGGACVQISLPAVVCSVVRDSRIPRVIASATERPVPNSLRMPALPFEPIDPVLTIACGDGDRRLAERG